MVFENLALASREFGIFGAIEIAGFANRVKLSRSDSKIFPSSRTTRFQLIS
jgi:hypothetical protein